jgi:hypothetical protein
VPGSHVAESALVLDTLLVLLEVVELELVDDDVESVESLAADSALDESTPKSAPVVESVAESELFAVSPAPASVDASLLVAEDVVDASVEIDPLASLLELDVVELEEPDEPVPAPQEHRTAARTEYDVLTRNSDMESPFPAL